jgi:superfamily II DNA or RNA helicase
MLGISATVDRKDGLTNVLHMFIGPKIYTEERKDEDIIEVRAIEYLNANTEYNEVAYDYMGNVAHTTMISKISNFPPRCDFIVKVLRDLIKENPEKQIMVLSQIRGLLTSIHEHLAELDVGFYVGGMKQKDLQATEEKQIVLATYAMAAEALDIKTLNTLVMVSPKTDIIQSVGRILRTRGSGKLIVDVIDTHDVFQNQWKKRRAYYKKCGYGISYVKSTEYVNMEVRDAWKRVSTATKIEENEKPTCFIDVSEIDFERKIN